MSINLKIKKWTPKWFHQFTRGLICSLRCSIICGPIAYQKITNKPILVVVPHPDDETFGCGGLISLKRAAGVRVGVVFLTNGEAVASGLGERPETVAAARQLEALNACQRLGVEADSVRWLHLPDGHLPHPGQPGFDKVAEVLRAEIEAFAPGEIYCPHAEDVHLDHIAAMRLTHQAVRLGCRPCAIFYYPIWAWYQASWGLRKRLNTTGAWRLDVAPIRSQKAHAMAAYLDAPKTSLGDRFCGSLPQAFIQIFRRKYEVYFSDLAGGKTSALLAPKALFVSPASAAYGSESSMLALLRARQFEAEVVCPGGGALERELKKLGIKHHAHEFNRFAVWQNPFWHLSFFWFARNIIKASKPDMVVINLAGNTPLVTLAALLAGIPIIRMLRFEFRPPSNWSDRWAWGKFDAIICPSETVKRQLSAWMPREMHGRIHRLYDSYSGRPALPHEVVALRQQFRLGENLLIGYVGRMDPAKHIETAIAAFAIVQKQIRSARLLVIGEATSPNETIYQAELQRQAADLGVSESVLFTGFIPAESMPAVFASLDACILPSESESFGMVLMEAWAQGVPTVASNVSGCAEISQASGGGFLAPVGDAEAFAAHVLTLLGDPTTATAMGRRGREWVAQNCDAGDYADRFESVIRACQARIK